MACCAEGLALQLKIYTYYIIQYVHTHGHTLHNHNTSACRQTLNMQQFQANMHHHPPPLPHLWLFSSCVV